MTKRQGYWESSSSKVAGVATGIALAAAGVVAMPSGAGHEVVAVTVACLAGIVGFLWAVGLATDAYPFHALALLLGLPFVAGLYPVGVHAIRGSGAAVGVALLFASAICIGFATWGAPQLSMRRAAQPGHAPAL